MKKDKILMISVASIILFNIFLLIILLFYNDIIILTSKFFKNITKEYYIWFVNRPRISTESNIISITYFIHLLFSIILLLEFVYMMLNRRYKDLIEKRYIITVIFIGIAIYLLIFLFIKYKIEHYRLFMTLIPTEILSMMLLSIIFKIKKYLD